MKKKFSFIALAFAMVAISALLFSGCDAFLEWLNEESGDPNNGACTHTWAWVVTTSATTTADGLRTERCSKCGVPSGRTQVIPKQVQGEFLNLPQFSFPDGLTFPVVMHYGANIGFFPPKVREWIINEAFTKEKMEGASMLDPSLKVWWSDDNNAVLFEASYTIAPGYKDAGTRRTWGTGARYGGGTTIFNTYGEYAYYQTLRFKYEYELYMEYLLENDPVFAEVINFAKKLCDEIEYDWQNFSGYTGAKAVRTPGKRYAVCSGYTDEVFLKALEVNSVKTVQRWTGPSHAWNVLKLTDGRTLYFDLTWFDNEHINHDTGIVYQTDNYGWVNITFHEHLFRFSNVGYGSKEFTHNAATFRDEKSR